MHRDIKPANIMCCLYQSADRKQDTGKLAFTYKLIDFGTALGVDERLAKGSMMTLGSNRGVGAGTPPYMSPEMYKVTVYPDLLCGLEASTNDSVYPDLLCGTVSTNDSTLSLELVDLVQLSFDSLLSQ